MSTKAERARVEAQRNANPPKAKQAPRPRRDEPIDTSEPGTSATDRKAGVTPDGTSTAERNVSNRSAKKGGAALEDSAKPQPSRKSTRGSTGRAKRTTNLQLRATRKTRAPSTRARKAQASKTAGKQ